MQRTTLLNLDLAIILFIDYLLAQVHTLLFDDELGIQLYHNEMVHCGALVERL